MAVGTVSGIDQANNWQLITSTSTTSGSSVTFNSISGYSKVMVVWKALRCGSSAWLYLKVNNDTTNGNYATIAQYVGVNDAKTEGHLILSGNSDTQHSGLIAIENVNRATPHTISEFASYNAPIWQGGILTSDVITRIDLYLNTSSFSSGTVELWGIAG